jgi:hypothetical protein
VQDSSLTTRYLVYVAHVSHPTTAGDQSNEPAYYSSYQLTDIGLVSYKVEGQIKELSFLNVVYV